MDDQAVQKIQEEPVSTDASPVVEATENEQIVVDKKEEKAKEMMRIWSQAVERSRNWEKNIEEK